MLKSFCTALLLFLAFSPLYGLAQEPPALETFTSPDGAFHFVYPHNYELLEGNRLLRATQSWHHEIPVCDFARAFACVIYSAENPEDTRFEAAALSVRTVSAITLESDCMDYTDQAEMAHVEKIPLLSVSINDHVFRQASFTKTVTGHFQSADLYRIFHKEKCYELQIGVTTLQGPSVQNASKSNTLGSAEADAARESLRLILSSVVFDQ